MIFCYDNVQVKIALKVIKELQAILDVTPCKLGPRVYQNKKVFTDVRLVQDCSDFFPAHEVYYYV